MSCRRHYHGHFWVTEIKLWNFQIFDFIVSARTRPHLDYGDVIYDQTKTESFSSKIVSVQYNASHTWILFWNLFESFILLQLRTWKASHCLLFCLNFSSARLALLNNLNLIDPTIAPLNKTALANILLFDDSNAEVTQKTFVIFI